MAHLIDAPSLSAAWLEALDWTLVQGGKTNHLVVAFPSTAAEDSAPRRRLDELLHSRGTSTVETVANTLFPSDLYLPRLGSGARAHLFDVYEESQGVRRRVRANWRGTYFYRLMAWHIGSDEPVNQLERTIRKLSKERQSGHKSSRYELGVVCPADMGITDSLSVYSPDVDLEIAMGFPCLSHISLTMVRGKLDMTALYRNQHLVRKAYGNYLGLANLLKFISREAGLEPGEVACIATHADAEVGDFGKRRLQTMIEQLRPLDEAAMAQEV